MMIEDFFSNRLPPIHICLSLTSHDEDHDGDGDFEDDEEITRMMQMIRMIRLIGLSLPSHDTG